MILIAIGANLPAADGTSALEQCRRAAVALDGVSGLQLTAVSRWYRTAPVPPSGQPDYINGVARLEGTCDPGRLLADVLALEARFGRQRSVPNAARTMDLDLIAYHDLVRDAPDPILPHPRCHVRAFVLSPLLDVAPDWMHPRLHQIARSLLAGLVDPGVFALAETGS